MIGLGTIINSVSILIGGFAGNLVGKLFNDTQQKALRKACDVSVLFIIIAVMTSSMGRGCIFSAIPVFVLEGGMTLLAHFVAPVMTETALLFLSTVGSILIFCVGMNLVWGKKVRVANLLPAIIFAVIASRLPIEW